MNWPTATAGLLRPSERGRAAAWLGARPKPAWPSSAGQGHAAAAGPCRSATESRGGAPPAGAHRRQALPVARAVPALTPRRDATAGTEEVARRRDELPGRGGALAGEEGDGHAGFLPRRRRLQANASEAGRLGGAIGGVNRGMEAWEGYAAVEAAAAAVASSRCARAEAAAAALRLRERKE